MNTVTVIGLGAMGARLSQLFLDQGREVTVWNRSRDKAEVLARAGARVADTPAAAIAASPLVVMCVYDYAAADQILAAPGAGAALAGKTLVQLTTGSPDEARAAGAWAAAHGARYLEGAIQAAPGQMGQADTPVLISGETDAFEQAKPLLLDLAGQYSYLGEQVEAAATLDLATLSYVYGAFVGFVHGASIVQSQGQDAARFGRIVAAISPGFGAFFAHEGQVIQSGDFAISESPLRISVEATRRIDEFSRAAGLNTEFSALAASLFQRAQAAGLADQEAAALIQLLRAPLERAA